jgi:hypothetical protein
MPSHDRVTANRARYERALEQGSIVFTDVEADGRGLSVIPRHRALAALTTWSTLSRASTFDEARADPGAAALVDEWLGRYLDEMQAEGETASGADDEPFDANEFFGDDYLSVWTPSPRALTARWLQKDEPELAEEYLEPDTGWGFDYESHPLVDARRRPSLEAALRARGYDVKAVAGLAAALLDPPLDHAVLL